MPPSPEKIARRFKRLNRRPHTHKWKREEIAAHFGDQQDAGAIAFIDNVPDVGGAPILLPMGNPTDGQNYQDYSSLPLFGPNGPSIHDVMQGAVLNCYFLAPLAGIAHFRPETLPAQLLRVGNKCRSRWNASGTDTWLEQDFMLPTNASRWIENTWVPQYEKGWAYWRKKENTYASSNWGNPIAPFSSLGWSSTGYTPGSTAWSVAAKALSERRPVCVLTKPTIAAGVPVVQSHAYALVSVNPNNTISVFNPWGFDGAGDGSNPDDGIVMLTIAQANANLSYVSVATVYVPPVALPTPTPTPTPTPPPRKYVFADYVALANHFGMENTRGDAQGDFNGDGRTNFADYTVLANNWDTSAGDLPPAPKPVTPENPMPATIELFKPDRETAKEWDSVTFRWKVSNALSVLLNGVEVKAEGSKTFPMPAGDLLVTLGATGTDGLLTTRSWTVKNTANNPAPQPTPTEDPIVSVVVTTTRKSGKVTNTTISS